MPATLKSRLRAILAYFSSNFRIDADYEHLVCVRKFVDVYGVV